MRVISKARLKSFWETPGRGIPKVRYGLGTPTSITERWRGIVG